MACRAGITTNPASRRNQWETQYPNLFGWALYGPFDSREKAQEWEDLQTGCERSGGGSEPDNPKAKWHGYIFFY